LAARNTFEMPAPDSIHPPQAESKAKAIDTRSISLDGLAAAAKGASVRCIISTLAPPFPDFELLLVRLVMLLHITR